MSRSGEWVRFFLQEVTTSSIYMIYLCDINQAFLCISQSILNTNKPNTTAVYWLVSIDRIFSSTYRGRGKIVEPYRLSAENVDAADTGAVMAR